MKKKIKAKKRGTLTVVAGPMFSGKTSKLVAMIDVFGRMGHRVLTVKPKLDARYSSKDEIHSHDHRTSKAIVVDGESPETDLVKILEQKPNKVIFDEVQFFEKNKVKKVVSELKKRGIDVIAAGLLYDYKREPFGATADLMGLADERMELLAICQTCGSLARHTQRVRGGKGTVEVGAADKYIASCDSCHRIYR